MNVRGVGYVAGLMTLVGVALVYFSGGVFIGDEIVTEKANAVLRCRYLTITRVVVKEYWHSAVDILGRSHCPPFIDG